MRRAIALRLGSGADASSPAERGFRPWPGLPYEPMFERKKRLTERLADAADLMIDFATLGEYGLEPVEKPPADLCRGARRRSRDRSDIRFAAIDCRDHLAARA